MSGNSKSFNNINLYACRVGGAPEYTPAHIQNGTGKQIRQMCTISVCQNLGDKESWFRITGWGKMADVMARSCAPGKELDIVGRVHTYKGRIAMPRVQGQPLQFYAGQDGQPLTTDKMGIVIEHIKFGNDSDKQLAFEIQNNMRPQLWNVLGHPDKEAWKTVCAQRNATQFTPGMTQFVYANVRQPNGQIIDPATIMSNRNTNAGAPAQGGYAQPGTTGTAAVQTNAGYQQPAAYGQGAPGFEGVNSNVQTNAVNVNGQTVGYQMPAGQAPAGGQPAGNGYAMPTGAVSM